MKASIHEKTGKKRITFLKKNESTRKKFKIWKRMGGTERARKVFPTK